MNNIKQRLVHIHHCRGVGWRTIQSFYKDDPTLAKVYCLHIEELSHKFQMKKEHATAFYTDLHFYKVEEIMNELLKKQITPITIFDQEYPKLLKEIYDPPWIIYCRGDLDLLQRENLLAVVGTRTPSRYGYYSLQKVLVPLIHNNWVIVSGLATGIDTFAHTITMKEQGKTIAVLGSGLNYIYPSENRQLANQIGTNHLLLSEYPPHQKPRPWQFPERNRIISGLCKGVLVVEAKEKSGSLITADQALEQGREVFAIPGSIFNQNAQGTNHLIQQGAKLTMTSEDIFEEW